MLLLLVVHRTEEGDRRALAEKASFRGAGSASARLPAGARNDLRVFRLRTRRIDSRARLSTEFSWLPECPVQNDPHCQGLPGDRDINEHKLPCIFEDESHQEW